MVRCENTKRWKSTDTGRIPIPIPGVSVCNQWRIGRACIRLPDISLCGVCVHTLTSTLLSPSKARMCVAIRSKKYRSWEMSSALPAKLRMAVSRQRSV